MHSVFTNIKRITGLGWSPNLPIELWIHIFRHVYNDQPMPIRLHPRSAFFRLAQVCPLWRAIIFNEPHFWSSITVHDPDKQTLTDLQLHLSRSAGLPLTIALRLPEFSDISQDAVELLVPYSPQWRSLEINLVIGLLRALSPIKGRLPLLESLHLHLIASGPFVLPSTQIDLFGVAPCLHTVFVDGIPHIPHNLHLPWDQLLDYAGGGLGDALAGHSEVLQSMLHLQRCTLNMKPSHGPHPTFPLPPDLRELSVRHLELLDFLERIPPLEKLSVTGLSPVNLHLGPVARLIKRGHLEESLQTLELTCEQSILFPDDHRLFSSDQLYAILAPLRSLTSLSLAIQPSSFSALVVVFFTNNTVLPALRDLQIWTGMWESRWERDIAMMLGVRGRGSLRMLSLAYRGPGGPESNHFPPSCERTGVKVRLTAETYRRMPPEPLMLTVLMQTIFSSLSVSVSMAAVLIFCYVLFFR